MSFKGLAKSEIVSKLNEKRADGSLLKNFNVLIEELLSVGFVPDLIWDEILLMPIEKAAPLLKMLKKEKQQVNVTSVNRLFESAKKETLEAVIEQDPKLPYSKEIIVHAIYLKSRTILDTLYASHKEMFTDSVKAVIQKNLIESDVMFESSFATESFYKKLSETELDDENHDARYERAWNHLVSEGQRALSNKNMSEDERLEKAKYLISHANGGVRFSNKSYIKEALHSKILEFAKKNHKKLKLRDNDLIILAQQASEYEWHEAMDNELSIQYAMNNKIHIKNPQEGSKFKECLFHIYGGGIVKDENLVRSNYFRNVTSGIDKFLELEKTQYILKHASFDQLKVAIERELLFDRFSPGILSSLLQGRSKEVGKLLIDSGMFSSTQKKAIAEACGVGLDPGKKSSYFDECLVLLRDDNYDGLVELCEKTGYSVKKFFEDSRQASKMNRATCVSMGKKTISKISKEHLLYYCSNSAFSGVRYSSEKTPTPKSFKLTYKEIKENSVDSKLGDEFAFSVCSQKDKYIKENVKESVELFLGENKFSKEDLEVLIKVIKSSDFKESDKISYAYNDDMLRELSSKMSRKDILKVFSTSAFSPADKDKEGEYIQTDEECALEMINSYGAPHFIEKYNEVKKRDAKLAKEICEGYLEGTKGVSKYGLKKLARKQSIVDAIKNDILKIKEEEVKDKSFEKGKPETYFIEEYFKKGSQLHKMLESDKTEEEVAAAINDRHRGRLINVTINGKRWGRGAGIKDTEFLKLLDKSINIKLSEYNGENLHGHIPQSIGTLNIESPSFLESFLKFKKDVEFGHLLSTSEYSLRGTFNYLLSLENLSDLYAGNRAVKSVINICAQKVQLDADYLSVTSIKNASLFDVKIDLAGADLTDLITENRKSLLEVVRQHPGVVRGQIFFANCEIPKDVFDALLSVNSLIYRAKESPNRGFTEVLDQIRRERANFGFLDVSDLDLDDKKIILEVLASLDPVYNSKKYHANLAELEIITSKDKVTFTRDLSGFEKAVKIPENVKSNKKFLKSLDVLLSLKGEAILGKIEVYKEAKRSLGVSDVLKLDEVVTILPSGDAEVVESFDLLNAGGIQGVYECANTLKLKKGDESVARSLILSARKLGYIGIKDAEEAMFSVEKAISSIRASLDESEESRALSEMADSLEQRMSEISQMDSLVHIHDRISSIANYLSKDPLNPTTLSFYSPLELELKVDKLSVFFPKNQGDLSSLNAIHGWCVGSSKQYLESVKNEGGILVCLCDGQPSVETAIALFHFEKNDDSCYLSQARHSKKTKGNHADAVNDFNHGKLISAITDYKRDKEIEERLKKDA